MADVAKALFGADNEVQSNWWKLTTPGDTIQGVLVDKTTKLNTLKNPPVEQVIYTILQDDDTTINVGGRFEQTIAGKKVQVISQLEQCKIGQYVGLKYEGERESAKPGMHPFKVIRVYTNKEMKLDRLAKYQGTDVINDASEVV